MASKSFDLGALLGEVSEINTERKQIEYIPLEKLREDPNNRYELNGIDELAANIEMLGLQQPLEVRPDKDQPGYYIVTSGHRRRAALKLLDEKEVPCIVVKPMNSAALQELRLIFANSDTRRMTPAELAWQAQRVKELFYQLKAEGHEFPGRMRDHVAAVLQMSKSKLGRLEAIQNNLKPAGLRKAFELGQINEGTAYELSKRSEAVQELADEMPPVFMTCTTEEAVKILDKLELEAAEDAKREAVPKINTAPVAADAYNAREEAEKYLEERYAEDATYFKLFAKLFDDFIGRVPVMGIDRSENIKAFKISVRNRGAGSRELHWDTYGSGVTVFSLEDKVPKLTRSWPAAYDMMAALAINRVKADLKKPVPKINTAPEWQSGTPENGKYFCKVNCDGALVRQILIYNNGWKLLSGGHPLDDACEVEGWWPLPEE